MQRIMDEKKKIKIIAAWLLQQNYSWQEECTDYQRIKKTKNIDFSCLRVRQILIEKEDLNYMKVRMKPWVLSRNIKARHNWNRERDLWKKGKWDTTVFSDEKKWNLDTTESFHFYWQDLRNEQKVLSRRQKGGGSFMIWATILYNRCKIVVT